MPQSSAKAFSKIFISYRRHDCPGHAGRLFDTLVDHFGADQIFMDRHSIGPGEDFVEVIEKAVGSSSILLLMIGRDWLIDPVNKSRLLDNANDFVRLEIATALNRSVGVLPILVEGAVMPEAEDLPKELGALTRRNAFELSDGRWSRDVEDLISYLDEKLGWQGQNAKPGGSAQTPAATAAMPSNATIPAAPGIAETKKRRPSRFDSVEVVRFAVWGGVGLLTLLVAVGALVSLWRGLKWGEGNPPPTSSPAVSPAISIEETVRRARALSVQENYVEAEPYWRAAVYHDRFNAEYNSGLAVALYFQKKYSEAEPFFRQAVTVNSGDAQTNADLGNVLSAQAKYAEAEAAHREAVRLNPNIHFMDALATDLYFEKKYAEAELWFRKALAVNPNDAELRNSLGNALFDQRKYEEAKTHYQEALRLQPSNTYFQSNVKKVTTVMAEAPGK